MTRVEAMRSSQRFGKALFAVLVIGVVLVAVWANTKRISVAAATQQGRDEIRIELSSNGFSPSEVQHAPGAFAISVENTTLSGEYKLRLKAEDGTVLSEVQVQKGSSAWTVTLQTGRYTLTEVNHPQWLCNIVVQ
ncbi:MAG TPA: hypothetical protein VFT48_09025 [Pyrinomonadaceae bacterium]|nr:hypothetical protein [Pyrinomonadaceae bacterium]